MASTRTSPSSSAATAFFDVASFPWLLTLQAHLADMREEAAGIIERYRYLRWRFPEIYTSDPRGVVGQRATFYLEIHGMAVRRNQLICPRTSAALSALPLRVTGGFYLLDARSHILPHHGATSQLLRAHMGIICPSGCHLRVGDAQREWSEGGIIVFDDSLEHEARNDSDEMRAILMIDFLRDEADLPRRREIATALSQRLLGPRDHAWLHAAGLDCDAALTEAMTRAPIPQATLDFCREVVAENGLIFP